MHDPKALFDEIETELAALKQQYDLFFQGGRRGEPIRERKDLETRLQVLSRRSMVKPSDQHRFTTLQGKFWSHVNLWARIIRDFEEGRMRRDKTGVLTRVGASTPLETAVAAKPAAPAPSAPPSVKPAAPAPVAARPAVAAAASAPPAAAHIVASVAAPAVKSAPPPTVGRVAPPVAAPAPRPVDAGFDQAAKELMQARQKCGLKSDPSELASLRGMLQSRAKEISDSAGGKKVAFHVSVEGGKPKIKARLS